MLWPALLFRNYGNSFHGVRLMSVVAALSMSVITETEHARSEELENPGLRGSGIHADTGGPT